MSPNASIKLLIVAYLLSPNLKLLWWSSGGHGRLSYLLHIPFFHFPPPAWQLCRPSILKSDFSFIYVRSSASLPTSSWKERLSLSSLHETLPRPCWPSGKWSYSRMMTAMSTCLQVCSLTAVSDLSPHLGTSEPYHQLLSRRQSSGALPTMMSLTNWDNSLINTCARYRLASLVSGSS